MLAAGAYGQYAYRPATWQELGTTLAVPGVVSRIGYPETAELIERRTGVRVALSREPSALAAGDVAYVVRLRYRVNPAAKGQPTGATDDDWEVARLERLPAEPDWRATVRQVADLLNQTRDTFRSRQIAHARALLEQLL